MNETDIEKLQRDLARIPGPGEPFRDISFHGWVGIACRLGDAAKALLAERDTAHAELAEVRRQLDAVRTGIARKIEDELVCGCIEEAAEYEGDEWPAVRAMGWPAVKLRNVHEMCWWAWCAANIARDFAALSSGVDRHSSEHGDRVVKLMADLDNLERKDSGD